MTRQKSRLTSGARFLNVDLDVRGEALTPLLEALAPSLFVLDPTTSGRRAFVRLELRRQVRGGEATRLDATLDAILDALSLTRGHARRALTAADVSLSIGVDGSASGRETSVVVATRHLARAARLGCALEVTVYPHRAD